MWLNMVGKRKKEKPTYVKVSFVLREKDIPMAKDFLGHKTTEQGLLEFLRTLGIKSYEYEFGQIVTQPSFKKFEGDNGIRGVKFDSVWLPLPVQLKGLKNKKRRVKRRK